MVVEQRDLGHHRVERDGARVVGHDQRAAVGRDVLQAARLDPEVLLVQRPQRRQQHVLGELGVEAELVDLDVAGQPAADERQSGGHLALPLRQLVGPGPAPARAPRRAAPRSPVRSVRCGVLALTLGVPTGRRRRRPAAARPPRLPRRAAGWPDGAGTARRRPATPRPPPRRAADGPAGRLVATDRDHPGVRHGCRSGWRRCPGRPRPSSRPRRRRPATSGPRRPWRSTKSSKASRVE